jgi:hypothetical protein
MFFLGRWALPTQEAQKRVMCTKTRQLRRQAQLFFFSPNSTCRRQDRHNKSPSEALDLGCRFGLFSLCPYRSLTCDWGDVRAFGHILVIDQRCIRKEAVQ